MHATLRASMSRRLQPVLSLRRCRGRTGRDPYDWPGEVPTVVGSGAVRRLDQILDIVVSSVEAPVRDELKRYVSASKGLEDAMARDCSASSVSSGLGISPMNKSTDVPAGKLHQPLVLPLEFAMVGADLLLKQPAPLATLPTTEPLSPEAPQPSRPRAETKLSCVDSLKKEFKPRRQFTVKHYADAKPSMHCHVCCRSAKNVKMHVCSRIHEGTCRKVVCVRCFMENDWKYETGWTCCHCQGICRYQAANPKAVIPLAITQHLTYVVTIFRC